VGGRLKNAETLDIFQRQPMLIPQSCYLSKLIFRDAHEKIMHGGPAAILSYVRERFWPIHGRNMARKVFDECVSCFRTKPTTVQPIMGDLPKQRIEPSRPFSVCEFILQDLSLKSKLVKQIKARLMMLLRNNLSTTRIGRQKLPRYKKITLRPAARFA